MINLLEVEINTSALKDCNSNDLKNVLIRYDLCKQALDDFLAELITFDEYLDLLEIAEIPMDDYLLNVEHNLTIAKIL